MSRFGRSSSCATACAALALLAGCATTPPRTGGGSGVVSNPAAPQGSRYLCEGNRSFSVEQNQAGGVTLYVTGQALRLKQVESASGTKYSDGAMTLWLKGSEAALSFNNAPFYRNCRATK